MGDEFIFDSDNLIQFCSFFDSIPKDDLTDSMLEVNLLELGEKWTQLQQTYRVMALSKDEDIDTEFKESARAKYATCTQAFQKCKAKIFDSQKSIVKCIPANSPAELHSVHDDYMSVKVPPCDTGFFHGGYEEWPSFRDLFSAVYVENPRIPPAAKLYHLRLKVQGKAAGVIAKYSLCASNFSIAWQALRDKYENQRVLVENQVKTILSLPPITVETSDSLQNLQSTINDCLTAIRAQNVPIDDWDPFIVILCSTKLPVETLSLWEQSLESHKKLVKWERMDKFLAHRCEVVECLEVRKKSDSEVKTFITTGVIQFSCKLCDSSHSLKNCSQFKQLTAQERYNFVAKNKICVNCLSYTHMKRECPSKFTCIHCKKPHHSLLHFTEPQTDSSQLRTITQPTEELDERPSTSQAAAHFTLSSSLLDPENTLLPTAIVQIEYGGEAFNARAFFDQGSGKNFITKRLQHRLMLPSLFKAHRIHGMGDEKLGSSSSMCDLTLISTDYNCKVPIRAIVVPKITQLMPSFSVPKSKFSNEDFSDIKLADPNFHTPGQVDLLIGSNVLPRLLLEGFRIVNDSLMAQATIFGWIITGPVVETQTFALDATEIANDTIEMQLRMFWEQEEIPNCPPLSKEDEYCESLYKNTTIRDPNGRYVVKLPFKKEFSHELALGPSRPTAYAQYVRQEQSLVKKPDLAGTYYGVLNEYLELNHMEPTSSHEIFSNTSYESFYLPHHAVFKPESRSTKVRVVFNASKRTSSGNSLNDILHVGPTLQADLMILILRWRLYRFVFNGDIEKMYRQILVHPDDYRFQRVLFREDPKGPVHDFSLKTVTFGVNCAPYLAIRTLIQLARDSEDTFPQASHILQHETYVDDILSGDHDLSSALKSLSQVTAALKTAGFPLKKITSNSQEILESVPKENLLDSEFLKFKETSATKTLGMQWNALSDTFSYSVDSPKPTNSVTKRQILSTVAKLFDPAGWISPVIIQAKMLLQQLWLEGTDWDDCVKPGTLIKWNEFLENLPLLANLKIPRWVNFAPSLSIQMHGFCDASEKAYCAAVYIRIQNGSSTFSNLLVSKGKVAPINPISLPRLELCGAVLLAKLIKQMTDSLPCGNFDTFLWCDSSIVLGWLEKPPNTWKTYVANRTSQIIRNVGNTAWRHVRSADNPADLGSRGCSTNLLLNNDLWWHGPEWLKNPPEEWPKSIINRENTLERREKVQVFHLQANDIDNDDILNRFSKWDRAIRVMSYVFRFINATKNMLHKDTDRHITLISHTRQVSPAEAVSYMITCINPISHQEFLDTRNRLISLTQLRHYSREYFSLENTKKVSKKSSLYSLNPYLDINHVIRANGRISNSIIPFKERHPIIIPVNSIYCKLFISFMHNLLMHADINLMLRSIRGEYYVSRLRSALKFCIRECTICVRYRQNVQSQMMAALPRERSSFSSPFTITGLDFAGPFSIKTSILRNAPYHKGYVCVFICFCTKAIHLELCSELTTNSFRAAFTRFIGRRGLPQKVMSDNGTNFVGAERSLRQEYDDFIREAATDIVEKYNSHGFHWSFIPPNAPHMGGLWEAGVKSFKLHFRKVANTQKFTYEEFSTLLARIESVLNSRPLSPMSDDPNEYLALTPGHFLRGAPLVAAPEAPAETLTLRDRWERLKSLHHQFARRWKDEYLKEIQKRYKWQHQEENIRVGQLVVIKDDLLPPCEWRLGRITKIYFGSDGLVRVADIRTQTGSVTRAIVKLCVLPVESSPDS